MARQQPTVLGIDVTRTFQQVICIAVEPRMKFQTSEQDTTADGRRKWDVTCSVSAAGPFGTQHSMLKVGVLGDEPQVNPGTPVDLVGLQVGVMLDGSGSPWFRAEEVRPLAATAPRKGSQSAGSATASEAA